MIDIKGLSRAAVLAALYNRARPQGLGHLQHDPRRMTEEEAETLLTTAQQEGTERLEVEYLRGRVMKVDLTKDSFDPYLYDRDNGEGAAAQAIFPLRVT